MVSLNPQSQGQPPSLFQQFVANPLKSIFSGQPPIATATGQTAGEATEQKKPENTFNLEELFKNLAVKEAEEQAQQSKPTENNAKESIQTSEPPTAEPLTSKLTESTQSDNHSDSSSVASIAADIWDNLKENKNRQPQEEHSIPTAQKSASQQPDYPQESQNFTPISPQQQNYGYSNIPGTSNIGGIGTSGIGGIGTNGNSFLTTPNPFANNFALSQGGFAGNQAMGMNLFQPQPIPDYFSLVFGNQNGFGNQNIFGNGLSMGGTDMGGIGGMDMMGGRVGMTGVFGMGGLDMMGGFGMMGGMGMMGGFGMGIPYF